MTYTSTLTSKGQVTIPKEIRARLGLKQGEKVEFVTEDDRTIIRPAHSDDNPFAKYAGVLGTFPGGIAEINAWIAEMRDDDE